MLDMDMLWIMGGQLIDNSPRLVVTAVIDNDEVPDMLLKSRNDLADCCRVVVHRDQTTRVFSQGRHLLSCKTPFETTLVLFSTLKLMPPEAVR